MTDHEDAPSRREAQLTREVGEAQLATQIAEIKARLDAMDHALRLTQEFPTAIDKAVSGLREFYDERFVWLEKLLEEQRRAEEKARDKAEETMIQQMRSLDDTYESRHETIRTMVNGLKESITRIEGEKSGASANWGWLIGVIGLLIAALAVGTRLPW